MDSILISFICLLSFKVIAQAEMVSPQTKTTDQLVKIAIAEAKEITHIQKATRTQEEKTVSKLHVPIAGEHSIWTIMHGVLALKNNFLIFKEVEKNLIAISAIDYLKDSVSYDGKSFVRGGSKKDFNFEEYPNQFLAIYSNTKPNRNEVFKTMNGENITIGDIFESAVKKVSITKVDVATAVPEVSWSLWALTNLFKQWEIDPDLEWKNSRNETLSLWKLLRRQLDYFSLYIDNGTHALYALANFKEKYKDHMNSNVRLQGYLKEIDMLLNKYKKDMQEQISDNGDLPGLYYFYKSQKRQIRLAKKSSLFQQVNENLNVNGRNLEWLMLVLDDKELQAEWVKKAVKNAAINLRSALVYPLAKIKEKRSSSKVQAEISPGPFYHTLHALIKYDERMESMGNKNAEEGALDRFYN